MDKQTSKKLKKIRDTLLAYLHDAEIQLEELLDIKQEKFDNLADNMWNAPVTDDMEDELNDLSYILECVSTSARDLEHGFTSLGVN